MPAIQARLARATSAAVAHDRVPKLLDIGHVRVGLGAESDPDAIHAGVYLHFDVVLEQQIVAQA
jgi:hypothetical protein